MTLPEPVNNKEETPPELLELKDLILQVPVEHRSELADKVESLEELLARKNRILGMVQEEFSQLRLDVKYLMFDLEATKAERDQARRELGEP